MDKEITLLDLFSGVGGFHKGLTEAGFKIKRSYFSEIDKHAIANYKNNFNYAEYLGSVVDVRGGGIDHPNIITFGSPCQDFSLAGKRAGMEGKRSSLVTEAIRLISECRPDFFIWENVKGTFSSNNGADFWAIIKAFADIGGYRLEWQLLNTSWFLPQNRERIYLVGHLAEAGRDFKGVFPFRESDFWTTEGSADTTVVRAFTAGGHSGGHHSGMTLVSETDNRFKSRPNREYNQSCPTLINKCGEGLLVNSIRRLTEIECERLQGFPDNWTRYGIYEKMIWLNKKQKTFKIVDQLHEIPRTQRYKMIGNSVTVDVVRAIAERLLANYYK